MSQPSRRPASAHETSSIHGRRIGSSISSGSRCPVCSAHPSQRVGSPSVTAAIKGLVRRVRQLHTIGLPLTSRDDPRPERLHAAPPVNRWDFAHGSSVRRDRIDRRSRRAWDRRCRLVIARGRASRAAARNNAEWCDTLCSTHGVAGDTRPRRLGEPTSHATQLPDAVTLDPAAVDGSILGRIDTTSPGCSIKDSFATLDLGPFGFEVVHEAESIYRDPPSSRITGPRDMRWTAIETADGLRAWEAAWDVDGDPDRLFRPALLRIRLSRSSAGMSTVPSLRERSRIERETSSLGCRTSSRRTGISTAHGVEVSVTSTAPFPAWPSSGTRPVPISRRPSPRLPVRRSVAHLAQGAVIWPGQLGRPDR